MPDVVGVAFEEAQRRLGSVGLRTGSVERHAFKQDSSGTVYNLLPRAGDRINRGASIALYVDVAPSNDAYQAEGSGALSSNRDFDLDWDPDDRGARTSDFYFLVADGWQLQPENGATIGLVRAGADNVQIDACTRTRLSSEPVTLNFNTPEIALCVLTNRGRLSLVRVSKSTVVNTIQVTYTTLKRKGVRDR